MNWKRKSENNWERLGMKFKRVKLGEYLYIKGRIGWKGLKKAEYLSNGNYRIINAESLETDKINWNKVDYISEARYFESPEIMLQNGDILISKDGTIGKIGYIENLSMPTTVASGIFVIRNLSTDIIKTRFIYYFLRSRSFRNFIRIRTEGSVIPHLYQRDFIDLDFPLPPIKVQENIVAILDAISNKIKLNNCINDNLEQQISEIYKAWYQDFSCAANVPMVASEYGIIPQGWHYSMLSDLCKSISVTHKFDTDKLIFLNTGDIEDGRFLHENYMAVSEMPGQAKKSIALGDILFSEIRPTNRHFAYVNFPAKDYVVSTKLMVIRATSLDSRRLYHFLTLQDVLAELQMQAESRSGTFPQIRFDNVSKLPILIADDKTETAFTDLLHTVYAQIEHNNLENGKLRALRDNLLPRLISGELDVSELDI